MKLQYLGFIPTLILVHLFIKKVKYDRGFRAGFLFFLEMISDITKLIIIVFAIIFGLMWALS